MLKCRYYKQIPYIFPIPFVLFLLTGYVKLFAQHETDFLVNHLLLSVEDRLASREVLCAAHDKEGFMWFGTRNELNRYDGKNFLLFTSARNNRNNMQGDKMVQMAIDDAENLYIEYGRGGFVQATNGKVDVMKNL